MEMNRAFNDAVVTEICQNSLSTYNRLINITQKQMNGRIADILLYLSDDIYKTRLFELTLSKQDIAELAGISKDSVVRVLRSFSDDGYIKNGGSTLEILDYDALVRINRIG